MAYIDARPISDEALEDFDKMILHCALAKQTLAPLAASIWGEVLKELDRRGRVTLKSGSYDNVANALIHRHRDLQDH